MTPELLFALAGFAFATSVTPGPNNLMLLASGANFGLRRTVPHMLGVALGFGIMASLIGLGLLGLFDAFPVIYTALKVVSVGYLIYLAWRIASAAPITPEAREAGRPLTFLQAAGFQWVNPKALSMAVSAVTLYTPDNPTSLHILTAAGLFTLINFPTVSLWAALGTQLRRVLSTPARLRTFNIAAALLLLASLWLILAPEG